MMRFTIYLTAFLFIIMISCESPKTSNFKKSLAQSERKAFDIILGKKGSGEKKLNCLAKDDYKCALAAVDQQALEFDALIADIKKLSTNDIPEGEPLKTASIEYYQSLKKLHGFDRKEIEQQSLILNLKDNERKTAQDELIVLARQKKSLYNAVYEKEALLHTAAQKFDTANGL